MIEYPTLDPVAFSLGPFGPVGPIRVHWYGIMYLIGFVAAWWLARRRARLPGSTWRPADPQDKRLVDVDDLIFFAALGVILGGRIGWALVYGHEALVANPLAIFRIWEGGMSFHGGLAGVMIGVAVFAKMRGRSVADVFDFTAPLPCIGLFFGRIGNFINNELWGKTTDVPWGFLVNGEVRHASQLYEATLEGLVLFAVLWTFTAKPRPRLAATGLFLFLYGVFRFAVEFVRVPDSYMGDGGYIAFGWLTTGQILCMPMIVGGAVLLGWAYKRRVPTGNLVAA